jgi:phytoene dehydrogenase-like protein
MQIHLALSAPPRWRDPTAAGVALLHLTGGLDDVSRAVSEAERGLLPVEATIVVGQPAAADARRCPPGASQLWIQLQELPRRIRGDAAGSIATPAGGTWDEPTRDAYVARILERLRREIVNLDEVLLEVRGLAPIELEERNPNLVGGDPYSGACSIDQFFLFRPFPGANRHRTCVPRLYHIGASTHPGPGLGAGSGHMLGRSLA